MHFLVNKLLQRDTRYSSQEKKKIIHGPSLTLYCHIQFFKSYTDHH